MSDVSKEEAVSAVRTLLNYVGEDPEREGLQDTPKRFVKAWDEWFKGYKESPSEVLSTYFTEVEGYDGLIMLKRIPFESYCEHHIAPIIGYTTIAYLPKDRVIGISKLARILDCFSKRLQGQEKMTSQIANAIEQELEPLGVAVIVTAEHHCMTTRGVHKHQSEMITSEMRGKFRDELSLRTEIMSLHLGG